jgi:hypothetical protein
MLGEEVAAGPGQGTAAGEKNSQYSDVSAPGKAHGGHSRTVRRAELWENSASKVPHDFSGYSHPTQPREKVDVWRLFVQGRDPTRRARQ